MSELFFDEVEFHPTSFCDGNGRLFWSGGELYRGIPEKCAEFTRRIFAEGIVDKLNAQALIPRTTLTGQSLPDYPIVLRHERIPFVSYAYEWSPAMLREAALLALRLLRELATHGLTLTDAAPWNILFHGSEARFIDFSSIVEAREDQGRIPQDLESYYLRSLELYAGGHGSLARLLLTDYEHGPVSESFAAATGARNGAESPGLAGKIWRRGAKILAPDPLAQMEQRLASYRFPAGVAAPAGVSDLPQIERVLQARRVASVLVVGRESSAVAFAAARAGAQVVAIDRDAARVDALYETVRETRADILPLIVDLRYPAAGHGVENNVLAPALSRLQCELAIALGLIPALVFEQRLRFEQIAGTFARLARQTLAIEFPAPENPMVIEARRDPYFHWFNLENFLAALRCHFASVRTESAATSGATLVICEKESQ